MAIISSTFNYIPGKDNAEGFTPQYPSENHCFADDASEDAEESDIPLSSVSTGGRPLCNLRFPDDIDLLGGSEEKELQWLTERLEKTANQFRQKQNFHQQH